MPDRLATLGRTLDKHGQSHLLAFADKLSELQCRALIEQINAIDFASLANLIDRYVRQKPQVDLPGDLQPAPYYAHRGGLDSGGRASRPDAGSHGQNARATIAREVDAARYRAIGEDLIRRGKVAAFTVAGGQGTRLGWNGPKGCFPATVVTGKPLFRVFAEQILATQKKYGVLGAIPWYIMTSPINDADTRAFFADNNNFNLPNPRRNIMMFPQGVLPSIDAATGKLLLASKHELALNPDGHGGSIKALKDSGALDDMLSRGIEHISYFQVDNPIVRCIDPLFLGLHAAAPDSSGEMSSKMVAKASAEEKVGVFCRGQFEGKQNTMVIEYSDMPAEFSKQTNSDGTLRFNAGSIAIHLIGVKFVQQLTADDHGFALPYHRADKKVPFVDVSSGRMIEPEKPNAVKLEAFVFDAIPLAQSSIVYETSRLEEFAPIKNAEGVDSPTTSHQIQSDRHGGWLENHGVKVLRGKDGHVAAKIEIGALTAMEASDLKGNPVLPKSIATGQEIVL